MVVQVRVGQGHCERTVQLALFLVSINHFARMRYKLTLVRSLFVAEDETLTTVIWKVPSWLVMQPDGGGDVGAILSVTP